MQMAITREVSASIGRCELTHAARRPIDVARARLQHTAYRDALTELGFTVVHLPEAPELPDAVFVEDVALVFRELAVITRPGAPSRRPETADVAAVLARYRPIEHLAPPAELDGGDVLQVGDRVWVGLSTRTNEAALDQLQSLLTSHGHRVLAARARGCLHLKSAATALGDDTVLVNPRWIDPATFDGLAIVEVDPAEPAAANVLRAGDTVIVAAAYPRTRERIAAAGFATRTLAADELAKAEGALTCCSLLFSA